ncbi:MAG: acetate--CoA ligase family protein [Candidatus Dojkabacteria bacterium]|jgi:acetyltransferase|nr:acetate--CoA ligase family protein [Candidatus Dojkabacteria bacterium]
MIKENNLSPKSIAIVGVSQDNSKIGSVLLHNLLEGGFNGKIYPINPKYKEVKGKECYPDLNSVKDFVDMVCIAVPSQFVSAIVDDCIEKRVNTVLVISAGFKETGEEGKKLEDEIVEKLKSASIRLIGPNSLGIINNSSNINLSFARSNPGMGSTAFISQSGAFATAILDMASKDGTGFSKVISIGNKADIRENELVEYFEKDKDTDCIAMYLEEFSDGKDFVELTKKLEKPVIIIAPGSSKKATEAISSHTGSLATSYDTTLTAIRKANLIKVESSEELFDTLKVIATKKLPKGKNVAVLTNAGGPGIMATDFVERFGLNMAEIGEKSKEKLRKDLPLFANVNNPIDILGDALLDRYERAIKILLEDVNVDSLLLILTPQLVTDITGVAKVVADIQKQTSKPIFSCFLGGKDIEDGNKILRAYGQYFSNNIEDTVKLISKVTNYVINENTYTIRDSNELKGKGKFKKDIEEVITDQLEVLDDSIAMEIAKEFALDLPNQLITANIDEAIQFATTNFPVAIKATSKDLAHKTDFKALFLDIRTVSELQSKFVELSESIEKATGRNTPDILIQEMIEPKVEFFIGANREGDVNIYEPTGSGFGHLLAIGQGGIYTEVYSDIEHILVPESISNIKNALERTNISTVINGYRGKAPLAKEALVETIDKVQRILVTYPQIYTVDFNPVILTEDRCIPVDIKIYIKS